MPIYRDTSTDSFQGKKNIILTVNSFRGTTVSASVKGTKAIHEGESRRIDPSSDLLGGMLSITCQLSNPKDNEISFSLVVSNDTHELTYKFPDDYKGSPDFDESDKTPTIKIKIPFS